MRAGLALIVFFINLAAVVSILGSRSDARRTRAWCAAVVLLPIAGAAAWGILGNRNGGLK